MKTFGRIVRVAATCLLLGGCASMYRSCSSFNAENFGSDWIVVQFSTSGEPFNCWELHNVSVAQEEGGTGGIHWLDTQTGHLVHVSGWYNRIQVSGQNFAQAASILGIDPTKCANGKYVGATP